MQKTQIHLSADHKKMLIEHNNAARGHEKLVKWLKELISLKKDFIKNLESQIDELVKNKELHSEVISEIEIEIDGLVKSSNDEFKSILGEIVTSLGIPLDTKLFLSFNEGVPNLEICD